MTTRTTLAAGLLTTFFFTFASIAVAEEATTTSESGKKAQNVRTVDLPCIRTAVEKRDNTIIEALGTFSTALMTTFNNRRDGLSAAWSMENRKERKSAISAAWKEFKTKKKAAEQDFKLARKNAWKAFNADRKNCRGADEARDMNEGE